MAQSECLHLLPPSQCSLCGGTEEDIFDAPWERHDYVDTIGDRGRQVDPNPERAHGRPLRASDIYLTADGQRPASISRKREMKKGASDG